MIGYPEISHFGAQYKMVGRYIEGRFVHRYRHFEHKPAEFKLNLVSSIYIWFSLGFHSSACGVKLLPYQKNKEVLFY